MRLGHAAAATFLTLKEEIERFLAHSRVILDKHGPPNLRVSCWIYDVEGFPHGALCPGRQILKKVTFTNT